MKLKLTPEQWRAFGQPDITNIIYLKDKITKKRVYYRVISSDFRGTRKDPRIKLGLSKLVKK